MSVAVQLLSEPAVGRDKGRAAYLPGGGSDNKIQIACDNPPEAVPICQRFVSRQKGQGRRVISVTNCGLFRPDHRKVPAGLN